MAENEAHGPIDFVLLEFSDDGPLDGPAAALLDLVQAGTVRLYDLTVLRKATDGSFEALEIGADSGFGQFTGARSGLLGEDDLVIAAEAMQPGTVAALIVYENAWAIPFVDAARRAGGEMVATTRIPAQDVMDVLDELESAG
jgi:hypothetical protein